MGCLATEGTRYAGGICLGLEGAWGLRPERFLWGKLRVHAVRACMLTHVQLCATPWTIWPARLLCPWNSPGKNTGVGCHSLLQGIFLTQGLNWDLLHTLEMGLLHCRQIPYHLSYHGSPGMGSNRRSSLHLRMSLPLGSMEAVSHRMKL